MKAKSIVTILLFCIAVSPTKAQTASLMSDTFTVSAQLMEKPVIIACGTIAYQVVVKFDATKTLLNSEHINVVIQCPDFYGGAFFEKGKHYRLVLSKDMTLTKGFLVVAIPENYDRKSWFMLESAVKLH